MASTPNDPFAKPVMIGGLILLGAAVFVLVSNLLSTVENNTIKGADDTSMYEAAANDNLAPLGTVIAVDKSVAPKARSGEEVYQAVCASCHGSGVLEAPKLEKAAWSDRVAKGLKGLMDSAINGLNQMPARGGDPSLSDEELTSAVHYMTQKSGFDLSADSGSGESAQQEQTAQESAEADTTQAQQATATTEEPAPAAPSAPTQSAAPSHAGIDGMKVYRGICFSCHDTGVANSPKPGDKAVWAERLSAGIDVMYDSVINGKGGMPPRGGNPTLSDDELKAAVDWMIAESQ